MRIDTDPLYRGRLAKIITMFNPKDIVVKGFNYLTKETSDINFTISNKNGFSKIEFYAPDFDGAILCRADKKSFIKKVGNIEDIIIFHYKKNFTIPYSLYEVKEDELIKKDGIAINIFDEFYYFNYSKDDIFFKLFNKYAIINKRKFLTNYDIIMDGDFKLSSTFEATTDGAEIGEVTLGESKIENTEIDVTIPDIKIKEY